MYAPCLTRSPLFLELRKNLARSLDEDRLVKRDNDNDIFVDGKILRIPKSPKLPFLNEFIHFSLAFFAKKKYLDESIEKLVVSLKRFEL